MKGKADESKNRDELLAELRELRSRVSGLETGRVVHELRVHQEELHAQQAQLAESQRLLEATRDRYVDLYDFAPIAYVTLDHHGLIEEINLTGASLLETDRSSALRSPFVLRVAEADRRAFLEHLRRCQGESGQVITELALKLKSGRTMPVQLSSRRARGASGAGSSYRTAVTDLTELRRAEQERFRADEERRRIEAEDEKARAAAAAKDGFLAKLSHELRTPLTPVLSTVTALEAGGNVPEALRPTFAMIRRNVELEVRLIDDLLDLTRITKGKLHLALEEVDLDAALRDVLEMCSAEIAAKRLIVTLDRKAAEHHVRADPARMHQVLWNLLKNAVRYTPSGGSIVIRTREEAGVLRISVSDSGIGIEPRHLDSIFLPFEQGSAAGHCDGLGLGLAICREVVQAHGGRIWATSEGPGRGATFHVELTTIPAPVSLPSPPVSSTAPPSHRMKILLVEDHADTAEALAYLLGSQGYEIAVADSISSAVALPLDGVDLVISDLGLPDGSGLDLLRRLHTKRAVPAIALSGYGTEEDIRESRAAGFIGHLTKPIDFTKLLETIAAVTASSG